MSRQFVAVIIVNVNFGARTDIGDKRGNFCRCAWQGHSVSGVRIIIIMIDVLNVGVVHREDIATALDGGDVVLCVIYMRVVSFGVVVVVRRVGVFNGLFILIRIIDYVFNNVINDRRSGLWRGRFTPTSRSRAKTQKGEKQRKHTKHPP
jgi:hypothetical protein